MTRRRLSLEERYRIGAAICGLFILLLLGKLLFLQTIRHESLYGQSENNRIRVQPVIPKRGKILDRERRVLVDNRASYTLSVIPAEAAKTGTIGRLSTLLGIDRDQIERRIKKNQNGRYQPALVKRDIPFDRVAALEEQNETYPGAVYTKDQVRQYLVGMGTECFTGYVGEVSPEEMKQMDLAIYRPGSVIGKAGIEKYYDRSLRGIEGTEYIEIAASGQLQGAVEDRAEQPPEPGSDLVLTIDLDIQKAASESFGQFCCGAAVVIDPRNGEVLALVSNPPNDANQFSTVMTDSIWRGIVADSTNPLLNRPLDGLYPPGSTYKLLTAGAALEAGVINRETMFGGCSGGYRFGNRVFHCWRLSGHGRLSVLDAIEQSCDIFFYQVAYKLGLSDFSKYSTACGFGRRTGVDLPREAAGLVPNKDWYDRKFGSRGWSSAVMLNLGIGQGEMLVTPLQLAQFFCGLANGGRVYRPHLQKSVIEPDGRETSHGGEVAFELPFSESTLQILRQGLVDVVNGPAGTARAAKLPGITVAGKTGTSQNPHGEDHAWFVGLAPAENPEIVACVIVENAGHGSEYGVPAVRNILEAYFKKHGRLMPDIAIVEEP